MPRARRVLLALAAGTVLALVCLEILLQAIAWWQWRGAAARSGGSTGERTILCLGDSFTYGLGASAPQRSYPLQLEVLLRERGVAGVRVVNGGWPGRDSREVLERADAWLQDARPELVYVLVGHNDAWSRTEALTLGPEAAPRAGFPLLWRTGRLLALVRHRLAGAGPAAWIGTWHAGSLEVVFEAGGRLLVGKDALRWRGDADALVVVQADGREQPARAVREGARLVLSGPAWPEPIVLEPGPAQRGDPLDAARAHLAGGRAEAALAGFAALRADPTSGADARAGVVDAMLALGRWPDALGEAEALQNELPAHAATARAFAALAAAPATRAAALRVLEANEDTLAPDLLRVLALLRKDADPGRAADTALRAVLADGRDERWQVFLSWAPAVSAAHVDAALAARAVPAARAAELRERLAAARRPRESRLDVLSHHLRQLVARVRAAGAVPVLLTYPEDLVGQHPHLAEFARQEGVALVDLARAFAARLAAGARRDELFVPDGHCNDAGYRLMAECVAEDAAARLRARR